MLTGGSLEHVEYLLVKLGLSAGELAQCTSETLPDVRRRFNRGFKRLVIELHPDHTGGDPLSTERFHTLMLLKEYVASLRPKPRSVQPRTKRVYVMRYWEAAGSQKQVKQVVGTAQQIASMKPKGGV